MRAETRNPIASYAARPAVRAGVTILELAICMSITLFLVGGLASAVHLANQSLEGPTGPTATSLNTSAAVDQFNADLMLATSFSERTPSAVTFTVPDRDGDDVLETIRYAWAGSGTPLTRTINGLPSPAVSLIDNVQAFDLSFLARSSAPPVVNIPEQALCTFNVSSTSTYSVTNTTWVSEYFTVKLPPNAKSWTLTHVKLNLKAGVTPVGTVLVSVSNVDANQFPINPPLETQSINAATLPAAFTWIDVPFSSLNNLSTSQGLSVQIKTATASGANSNAVVNIKTATTTSGMSYTTSSNGGATWLTAASTSAIEYQVYGTLMTQGP